jgi:septal ring factor EnvC (AmiA/AmiB activator)
MVHKAQQSQPKKAQTEPSQSQEHQYRHQHQSNNMWAAIKSDFKEFVSTAAEETNAVTNKALSERVSAATGVVSTAASKAVSSVENVGASVKGLSGMIGGVVAPVSNGVPVGGSSNASKVLLVEEEEEELGWDDDEDDLEIEEMDAPSSAGNVVDAADAIEDNSEDRKEETTKQDDDDTKEILLALQSKLSEVEKERNELQTEHRKQTAELVELRSKVEELENTNNSNEKGDALPESTNEEEMQALREEIASLKLQLEQSADSQAIQSNNQNENEELLKQYQQQIAELNQQFQESQAHHVHLMEQVSTQKEQEFQSLMTSQKEQLEIAQTTTIELQTQLKEMEKKHASALEELASAIARTTELEGETSRLSQQLEEQAVNFAATLEQEVEKTRREVTSETVQVSATPTETVEVETAAEDEAEISSGEKITVDDSFVTAGELFSPKAKGLEGGDEEEEDWGDGGWGDEED